MCEVFGVPSATIFQQLETLLRTWTHRNKYESGAFVCQKVGLTSCGTIAGKQIDMANSGPTANFIGECTGKSVSLNHRKAFDCISGFEGLSLIEICLEASQLNSSKRQAQGKQFSGKMHRHKRQPQSQKRT